MTGKIVACCFVLGSLILPLEAMHEGPSAAVSRDLIIYIKNSTEYLVRVSVGPEYPSSIALYPGQILEFPRKHVITISASSYGKYSHFWGALVTEVAELNIEGYLHEHSECDGQDCAVDLTYEKDSEGIGQYLMQGKWKLTLQPIMPGKDIAEEKVSGSDAEALYAVIKGSDATIPDSIVRDVTLIWSMFPRVASKIINKDIVFPFNILGLDVGGLTFSDQQLRNWGNLLFCTFRRRFGSLVNPSILDAVNMIIADSVEWMRHHEYYFSRGPDYPMTLLHIRTPAADVAEQQKADCKAKNIIAQLKEAVADNANAQALIGCLENEVRLSSWVLVPHEQSVPPMPPVPPTPPSSPADRPAAAMQRQEKHIAEFFATLAQKRPEEQDLLDKVCSSLLLRIEGLGLAHAKATLLKNATLDKLTLLAQNEHSGIQSLSKVDSFISGAMIRLASNEPNPAKAMNEWISRVVQADRAKAFDYAGRDEQGLRQVVQAEASAKDYQNLLFKALAQRVQKWEDPE